MADWWGSERIFNKQSWEREEVLRRSIRSLHTVWDIGLLWVAVCMFVYSQVEWNNNNNFTRFRVTFSSTRCSDRNLCILETTHVEKCNLCSTWSFLFWRLISLQVQTPAFINCVLCCSKLMEFSCDCCSINIVRALWNTWNSQMILNSR